MLNPEEVKPLLLHSDPMVRARAAEYFAEPGYGGTDVADAILQCMLRLDWKQGYTYIYSLRKLPVHTAAVPTILHLLATAGQDHAVRRDLNHALGSLPLDFWERSGQEIRSAPHVDPTTFERVERRRRMAKLGGRPLFRELIELCDTQDSPDDDTVRDVLEALVGRSYPAQDVLVEWLDEGRYRDTWMEVFLVDLAGLMRVRNAVPFLVGKLGHESNVLTDSAQAALWRIGGKDVVDAIGRRFPAGSPDFKLYATGVLGGIHLQESEDLCLRLLARERAPDIRADILRGMVDNFSVHAIELMRRELGAGADPRSAVDMEEDLLMLTLALGVSVPGQRQLLEERDRRYERAVKAMAMHCEGKSLTEMEKAWNEAPLTAREVEEALFGPRKPLWMLPSTEEQQTRPNAACPCGSGKKYKKCCGRS